MSDDDVEFVIINKEKGWVVTDVEFVNKHEFRSPVNSIQSACTVSPVKLTDNPRSPTVVDDNDNSKSIDTSERSDSSKTSDTKDESGGDDDAGQAATEDGTEERRVSERPNNSSPSMTIRWTVSAYRSKKCALNQVFDDPWESFQRLPVYFHVLEQSNPRTVTKIKTDSKNVFKYGFMAVGASIKGFNYVIRRVICIDVTHLKARTRGVLLVIVCKDENEMIYHLAFGLQTLNA
ncbi:hypothetical protein Ddye_025688 [Dipteronia dyeriana]|uniref:MULE transposase domain-containing protein n=1 Tax=Dipteronia dyeriana TaxID=168575 RepID=A0AAD9WPR5_9ROSI|nr:hypothetical protein Ddye_025688 [Dipteronia dyeriana]